NSFALAAATAALQDESFVKQSRELNSAGMAQLEQGLSSLALGFIPSKGNFIAFDTGRPCLPVFQALLQQGVIVRPIANYGLPNYLRVSIGLESENARFLAALAQVLR
ncbi:MAG TPA: aminotransferase class I/II-fold pyridoxal phosphate-dependent enzyme, partial [Agitococcus sp.]|nr:aminotransferase class I/II-fold pyridoxal phosphate-dependent enzyme [Agitococcus sp.]